MNAALFTLLSLVAACNVSCVPKEPNELDKLRIVRMEIQKQAFELWVAEDDYSRPRGLMFITEKQMEPLKDGTERGMIFSFPHSQQTSFWMKNTIIPLDIIYVTSDGEIVSIYTMTPLDSRHGAYEPAKPYRYAIETRGGKLQALGLKAGDKITIPDAVLKR